MKAGDGPRIHGVAGVILGAGRSTRMGRDKALLDIRGRTALERLVSAYEAVVSPLVLVASGAALERARAFRGVVLVEGDPAAPMIDSLARAIASLGSETRAVIVQPVDAPFTEPGLLTALALRPGTPRVPTHGGVPGHPVLVPRELFDAVRARPEGGLRTLLRDAEPLPWDDERILADLDTPKDAARWLSD